MKVGDEIEFTSEKKGDFDRFTSIGGTASSPGVMPSQPVSKPGWKPKDPMEFNAMMATRYAMDLMIAQGGTVKEAVKVVRELFDETIKAQPSDIPLADQLRQLTTEVHLDVASRSWKEYVFKRFKKYDGFTSLELYELVDTLREVKEGKKRSVMTPDGFLTFVNA